jgi:MFS family permease
MNQQDKSLGKFLLLWSGELVSAIGSGLTSFGLAVYVYKQTGMASAVALVTLLAFMPSLLLSAAAGVLADRCDRRLLMIMGDTLYAVGVAFILYCMLYGEVQLWQICIGVTMSSVFSSLLEPAYKATITDLLIKEQYTRASGLIQ